MKYDVITIGGGLGGLVSSALLAKGGKRVLLLEQHAIPGGYCTSYKRKGFTFNVPSVMTGLGPNGAHVNPALSELGFYDEIDWAPVENFGKYIYPDFEIVMPANNLPACQENVRLAFPRQADAIATVFADVARVLRALEALMGPARGSLKRKLALLGALPRLARLAKISYYDYLRKLTSDERLIKVLSTLWGYAGLPARKISAMGILMMSGECYGKAIAFPQDGFQAVADLFADKIVAYGGEIKYRTAVERILLEGKRAKGVETADGEQYLADVVVSNADTKRTFFDFVGRSKLSRRFAASIDAHTPSASGLSLHLGTELDLSRQDLCYGSIFCHESWDDGDAFYDKALSRGICLDSDKIGFGLQAPSLLSPRLAPAGKHIVHVLVAPIGKVDGLDQDGLDQVRLDHKDVPRAVAYREAKERLTQALIRKLERFIPGISGSVVVSSMATPSTFQRYTGASGGAWYDGVRAVGSRGRRPAMKTPFKGLLLTGTKAFGGGGMPPAILGGITTADTILGTR